MSHQFTDAKDRSWSLKIDVNALRRVRDQTGLRPDDFSDVATFDRLKEDVILLVDMLWAIIEPQAKQSQVSPADFAEGLIGEKLEEAVAAWLEGLIGFFPRRKQEIIRRAINCFQEQQKQMEAAMEHKLSELEANPEFGTSTDGSTSSPASSDSTPDP